MSSQMCWQYPIWGACFERHWQNERRHPRSGLFFSPFIKCRESELIQLWYESNECSNHLIHPLYIHYTFIIHSLYIQIIHSLYIHYTFIGHLFIFTFHVLSVFFRRIPGISMSNMTNSAQAVGCLECHGTGTALGDPIEAGQLWGYPKWLCLASCGEIVAIYWFICWSSHKMLM